MECREREIETESEEKQAKRKGRRERSPERVRRDTETQQHIGDGYPMERQKSRRFSLPTKPIT